MKIKREDLIQIIKEEAEKLKTRNALIAERTQIENQIKEMYGEEMNEEELDELFGFGGGPEKFRNSFKTNIVKYYADLSAKWKAAGKQLPATPKWATAGTQEFETAAWAAAYLKNPDIYWNEKTQMFMPRQFSTSSGSTAGEAQGGRGTGVDLPTLQKYIAQQTGGAENPGGGAQPTAE